MTYLRNILENVGNYPYDILHLKYLEQYIYVPFSSWLGWIVTLVAVVFLLQFVWLFMAYLSALLLLGYRYCYHLQGSYNMDEWDGARNIISTFWDVTGCLWYGYEVVGLENIPDSKEGGALLIYYHGTLPLDFYFILHRIYLIKRRCIRIVVAHFFFNMPGFKGLLHLFHTFTGSFEDCVKNLKEGHLVAISPGGVPEAQFGDEEYQLIWGKRIGFAKAALEAKVPIIPVFTQNLREAFRTVKFGSRWLKKLYEITGLPVVPIYGGLPVKLRTYIGKPIPYDPNMTAEELAAKTKQAIENLISLHQRVPGNILKALIDRVHEKPKHKKV